MALSKVHGARRLAEAQFNLGIMYHNGLGVPQDYAQAVAWYRKAAAQGFAEPRRPSRSWA